MMNKVEEMLEKICLDLHGTTKITVGSNIINFQRPWARISLFDAIKNSSDGYSRTQAHKLFNNHVKADGLNKLLSKLEDMNLISSQTNKDDDSNVLYYAN